MKPLRYGFNGLGLVAMPWPKSIQFFEYRKVNDHHFVRVARPAGREPQLWEFPAILADQILDKETSIGAEFVEPKSPLGLAVATQENGSGEIARPCGLSGFPRVRRIIDFMIRSLGVAHIKNIRPAFKLACGRPRIPHQQLD
jgi:hypothetical protein